MIYRTKTVKKLIDEIEKLKREVEEAKKEPEISYGEAVVPVCDSWGGTIYFEKDKLPLSKVVEMLLAHSGMEIVKEPQKDEKIVMKKRPKTKKRIK